MGKFSDYIEGVNAQTNILRNNLTNVSGIDCSDMSIGNCADIIKNYITDNIKDDGYVRPQWYPDIKQILNSAPIIEKDGVVYYPVYSILLQNVEVSSPFYKSVTSTSTAPNYYRGTGCDAVLCSDVCNNDISNASPELLETGTTIIHSWDLEKDIKSEHSLYGVRWAVIYSSNKVNVSCSLLGETPLLELVTGDMKCAYDFMSSTGWLKKPYLEYIEFQDITDTSSMNSSSCSFLKDQSKLKECYFHIEVKKLEMQSICSGCSSLRKITFKAPLLESLNRQFCYQCMELTTIILDTPNITSVTSFCNYCHSLKNIPLPNSVVSISSSFQYCFNFEEIVFPSNTSEIISVFNMDLSQFPYWYSKLKKIVFPSNLNLLSVIGGFSRCQNLKYIELPSSLVSLSLNATTFGYAQYIKLWNDFDISGVIFSGQINKLLKWLKDLCIWLKDRTGEDANTMIIGSANIKNAENIWLTFNPNDKRDITWVEAGTEGAINIIQFITEQLNWTLS